jgi:hypothetical protein
MQWLIIVALVLVMAAGAARAQGLELTKPMVSVGFANGSAELEDGEADALKEAVWWMKNHPMRLLVIQGYASRTGTASANMTLSQERSDAVRDKLLALGADPLRIIEVDYGEEDAPGRRVDVRGTLIDFPDLVMGQQPLPSSRGVGPRPVPPPERRRSPERTPNS